MRNAPIPACPSEANREHGPDLLRLGFDFMPSRRRRFDADTFETRIAGLKATCAAGREAAEMFYTPDRFTRRLAMPPTTLRLIQGAKSVAVLDGAAHRRRKALHLQVLTPENAERLGEAALVLWRERALGWGRGRTDLLHEGARVFTEAAFLWAGVRLRADTLDRLARAFHASVDGAGSAGPRMLRGLVLRAAAERWGMRLIAAVRSGEFRPASGTPLAAVAGWTDADGRRLSRRAATQELFNWVRTTSAIARYVGFSALLLARDPELKARIAAADAAGLRAFAHEVRRWSPFVPTIGGRALARFEWRGRTFERGAWVLLDIHGTDRDPRCWPDPDRFDPDRFLGREPDLYAFVPQGGGDTATTHRCPGEGVVMAVLTRVGRELARADWRLPPQDLRIDPAWMPGRVRSGPVVEGYRPSGA